MRFHETVLTNADVANYLRNTNCFTKGQIIAAIMTGDRYGLEIKTSKPIILSDFLRGIGYPPPLSYVEPNYIDLIAAHKEDARFHHEEPALHSDLYQRTLYHLLGISATELTFDTSGLEYIEILLNGTLSISWLFFNKIHQHKN